MALPDRIPTNPYSAVFYGEVDDDLRPEGRVGFDVFYPNPVLELARSEFDSNPEQAAAHMTELSEALLAYPNLPVKMTVNLGGTAATKLDLSDVLTTFRQKAEAGYKYHGDEFEAQIHEAQATVASFLKSLSAPLETVCSMKQSGALTEFAISMPQEIFGDINSLRPILNVITAYRLQATAQAMRFPPQKAPTNNY